MMAARRCLGRLLPGARRQRGVFVNATNSGLGLFEYAPILLDERHQHSRDDRRRCGGGRPFAPVSRGPNATPADTITVGAQRWNRFCRISCGRHLDRRYCSSLVAIDRAACPESSCLRGNSSAPDRVPAPAWSRRRGRRWWQQATTRAITRGSDWTRSAHGTGRQQSRRAALAGRCVASAGTGTARRETVGIGHRGDDRASRDVPVAPVLAWTGKRRGCGRRNGLGHRIGIRPRRWRRMGRGIRRWCLPPGQRRRTADASEAGDAKIHGGRDATTDSGNRDARSRRQS